MQEEIFFLLTRHFTRGWYTFQKVKLDPIIEQIPMGGYIKASLPKYLGLFIEKTPLNRQIKYWSATYKSRKNYLVQT